MDGERFDGLTRRLGALPSRRALLRLVGLYGMTAAITAFRAPDAGAKRKKKKCKGTKCSGRCFEKGAVCCEDAACPGDRPLCCPAEAGFPAGCALAGRTCCLTLSCAAEETCCKSASGGACVPQGTACPA